MIIKAPFTPLNRQSQNGIMPALESLYHDKELRSQWSRYMVSKKKSSKEEVQSFFTNLKQRRQIAKTVNSGYGLQKIYDKIKQWNLDPVQFKYQKAIGVEIESFSTKQIPNNEIPFWVRATGDGSIVPEGGSNGVEWRVLTPRDRMEGRLHSFCKLLHKYDFKVNRSCGMHVHFDFRGWDEENVIKEARKLNKWLKTLKELVPSSRRANSYARLNISRNDRYRAVNVCSFSEHGSLEVRLHSGTTDFTKIVNWIRLIEAIFQKKGKPQNEDCIQALMELPLTREEILYWINRHKELNPKLYNQEASKQESE